MSKKNDLIKHIDYLEARRSGAEFVADMLDVYPAKVGEFIKTLSISIQENKAQLAVIKQEEARIRAAEKAAKAAEKNSAYSDYL